MMMMKTIRHMIMKNLREDKEKSLVRKRKKNKKKTIREKKQK
jgi:hypothetical protein